MDIVNIDALKAQGRILDAADVDPNEDYFVLGKYTNKYTTDNFKYTKYPVWAIKAGDVMGVQSVTGLNTDNTDPFNPIVKISVDGVTIIGEGTPASPLVAVPQTKYKVYTALLTQNGGSNPLAVSGDGEYINFGVTYEIVENPDNYDLTIYGAPNNNVGTYFVSNQTIALPYTVSLQLLTNTGAPVATVLENTIGNIWFTFLSTGNYRVNSSGLFTSGKLFQLINNNNNGDVEGAQIIINFGLNNINTLNLQTGYGSNYSDSLLNNVCIEIRVYN